MNHIRERRHTVGEKVARGGERDSRGDKRENNRPSARAGNQRCAGAPLVTPYKEKKPGLGLSQTEPS
jgi:hypothetical protein